MAIANEKDDDLEEEKVPIKILKPLNGKKMIVYIDDLHMPEKDGYGQ